MKAEELADKHANEYVKHWIVGEDDYALMQEAYKDGFLDGLKEGRPQWHDLRKDPADLPKDDNDMLMSGHLILLTKLKGTDDLYVTLGRYNFSTQEFCYQHIVGLIDVVAWQEIVLPLF